MSEETKQFSKRIVKHKKPNSYDEQVITLKIKPLLIERTIYITIIIALLIFSLINPMHDYYSYKKLHYNSTANDDTAVINKTLDAITGQTPNNSTIPLQNSTVNADASANPSSTEDAEGSSGDGSDRSADNVGLSGTVTEQQSDPDIDPNSIFLLINDVSFQDKTSYKKITDVDITIENQVGTLYPFIEIIIYDDETKQYDEEKVRGTARFDIGIPAGSTQDLTISLDMPPTFRGDNPEVTVITRLSNSKVNPPAFLKKTTRKIMLE